MFPLGYLSTIVAYTNNKMESKGFKFTTRGEILKFFGILILMTRFEFNGRRSLWSTNTASKYLPPPMFGNIMSRNRFEQLRQNVMFGSEVSTIDRWGLVTEFINAINEHRSSQVIPSERICVDESMSRWYGLGGYWIDVGLPHYVSMDRKP